MARSKFAGLLRQRCPRCLEGPVYRRWIVMHQRCPVCDLHFEREPGYFMGSLYVSYGAAVVLMVTFMLLLHLALPDWDSGTVALLAIAAFVPLAPLVSRYARVVWMYFDHWAWPPDAPPPPA